MANFKTKLSAVMLALIAGGASAPVLMSQLQTEKEDNRLVAYRDGGGLPTICGGVTYVDGKKVTVGMRLTAEKCAQINAAEQKKALEWVDRNVQVPLTEPQKVGIASFCPWNIGPSKCLGSTFYKKLNAGDRKGACAEIKRWIYDGGKDCNVRSNNCYGQIERRAQEAELTCWGLDDGA